MRKEKNVFQVDFTIKCQVYKSQKVEKKVSSKRDKEEEEGKHEKHKSLSQGWFQEFFNIFVFLFCFFR